MQWNVYIGINRGRLYARKYDILTCSKFRDGCKNAVKICGENKAAFREYIIKEILICFNKDRERLSYMEIGIYDQIMLNKSALIDYLWANKNNILKLR